jgi:broad specificity phosphatase PhoE
MLTQSSLVKRAAVGAVLFSVMLFVGCAHGNGSQQTTTTAVTSKQYTLYLARHGQTEWNRVHRFQGDPDLDQVGYLNRISLWMVLKDAKLTAIFTSALLRTQRTAELIAKQHGLKIQPRAAIDEIRSGALAGICMAYMEATPRHPSWNECKVPARGSRPAMAIAEVQRIWAKYRNDKSLDARVPFGESWNDIVRRGAPFVRGELAQALAKGNVLVVGHGLMNRALLHLLTGWPLGVMRKLIGQRNDQIFRIDGLGTDKLTISLYTPKLGWKRCTPPKAGDRVLDCYPPPKAPASQPSH